MNNGFLSAIRRVLSTGMACTVLSAWAQEPLPPLKLTLTKVAGGLTSPVGAAAPDDGTGRLFIIEQRGVIKILSNGRIAEMPFLDLRYRVDGLNIMYSEKGLLGLVFHPAYKTNGRFFVYYSAPARSAGIDHTGVLSEFHVSSTDPDRAGEAERVILEIPQPESNHNGGGLAFGRDGYLYIGLGDGGGGGDRHGSRGNGQDLSTWLGKLLRIDVDRGDPYAVPPDNPFMQSNGARPEIWAYGLRNPWRFSFDRATGWLFCADVGQNHYEEVDLIRRGGNYGWRIMEGNHCFDPPENCPANGLVLPIHEYDHDAGVSVCGGYMYRSLRHPALHGHYIFGDWSGKLFYLKQQEDRSWRSGPVYADGRNTNDIGSRINSFAEDADGDVYVITQKLFGPANPTGAVYRVGW